MKVVLICTAFKNIFQDKKYMNFRPQNQVWCEGNEYDVEICNTEVKLINVFVARCECID